MDQKISLKIYNVQCIAMWDRNHSQTAIHWLQKCTVTIQKQKLKWTTKLRFTITQTQMTKNFCDDDDDDDVSGVGLRLMGIDGVFAVESSVNRGQQAVRWRNSEQCYSVSNVAV